MLFLTDNNDQSSTSYFKTIYLRYKSVESSLQIRFKSVPIWAKNGTYMGVTWELHGRKKEAVLNEFWGFKRTVMS